MSERQGPYRAGELAHLAGVSTDTLRYYERRELLPLPPRSDGGYRLYPAAALRRVLLVRRALALGLSVKELAALLRVRDAGGVPCRKARGLLATKLETLDLRLRELQALRRTMRATLSDWDARLAAAPAGTRAGLLDSIVHDGAVAAPMPRRQ
jgi:DNA-binding transcriptional MerR regulator